MASERTLILVKPDAMERGLAGEILGRFERRGLTVRAAKLLSVGIAPAPGPDADPVELAAWTNTCRVILNLHETITRD